MPFYLIKNDITTMHTDAIVNAANSRLAPGGGVCGAIFAAAGFQKLDQACRAIGRCPTGQAVITDGFALPAKSIIHTVGPIWQGGGRKEAELLHSCYQNSLLLAEQHHCASIAFPLISAGIFGYPKSEAFRIAVDSIRKFLESHEMEVILVLFERSPAQPDSALLNEAHTYINDHYAASSSISPGMETAPEKGNAPFSSLLLQLIRQSKMTNDEICVRANLSRKQFSNLLETAGTPDKSTILSLAAALRLDLHTIRSLLQQAGYSLSRRSKSDLIFEYMISRGRYDIFEINQMLFSLTEKPLGIR